MAVLIDPPAWPAHGRLWSHLVSDTALAELHAFAAAAGVPERGFEGDHYDVPAERYAALVDAGAEPVSSRELLARLVAAGLRVPKLRGERVLSSVRDGAEQVDVVHSSRWTPTDATSGAWVVATAGDRLLVPAADVPGGPRRAGETVPACALRVLHEAAGVEVGAPGVVPVGYRRFRPADGDARSWRYEAVLHVALCHDDDRLVALDRVRPRAEHSWWWPLAMHAVSGTPR